MRFPLFHRAALIFILLLTSLIVSASLGQDMWADEPRTLFYAGAAPQYGPTTLTESLDRIAENLWQAPAYYIFIWGWGHILGWSILVLRLPSLIFGLLTILLTYDLTRRYASQNVALYAAFVLAFGAFFLNFLHDMRAYTLFSFLTVLMLWSYTRLIHSKNSRLHLLLLFTASVTGLIYTHFFAAFPIAALGCCHLLLNHKHRLFWPIILAFVLSGLLFLPWLQVLIGGAMLATEVPRRVLNLSALDIIQSILYFITNGSPALGLILVMFALPIWKRPYQRLFLLWLLLSAILLWIGTRIVPALTDVKYMLFLWPILAIMLAHGIQHLVEKGISPILLVFGWSIMFIYCLITPEEQIRIHPWYRAPFTELAQTLTPLTTSEDVVLFVDPNQEGYIDNSMLSYYFYGLPVQQTEVIRDGFATSDQAFTEQASLATQNAERVWLAYDLQAPNWRTSFLADGTLPTTGFTMCGTLSESAHLSTTLYARQPTDATLYTFGGEDDPLVQAFLIASPRLTEDKALFVNTGAILTEESRSLPYSLAIHIENTAGNVVAQADKSVGQSAFNCQLATIDMRNVPPGNYSIRLAIYNWQTGERLFSTLPSDDQRPVVGTVAVPN